MSGVYNGSPMRFGAERGSNLEILHESLVEGKGTAFSVDEDSYVWAESLADAKAIEYLWSTAQRFANQWNAEKMTDFLPRWERIYGIRPLRSDTLVERRAKVKAKMEMLGMPPTYQVVDDLLKIVLGDVYDGLVHTSSLVAETRLPGGATISGGPTIPSGSWYSTISYLAIKTIQPTYMDDSTFYKIVAQIYQFLDDLLPAWVTFSWFKDGVFGTGFYLDTPHNLDNQRFN